MAPLNIVANLMNNVNGAGRTLIGGPAAGPIVDTPYLYQSILSPGGAAYGAAGNGALVAGSLYTNSVINHALCSSIRQQPAAGSSPLVAQVATDSLTGVAQNLDYL